MQLGMSTIVSKRFTLNRKPAPLPVGAPDEAVRREFSRRLQDLMHQRGMNGSDLARAAAKHMPDKKFGKDMVSRYLRGLTKPYPVSLKAIAKALGVEPSDLMPQAAYASSDEILPEMDMKTTSSGRAWLRVNREVSMATALEIMQLIGKEK